MSVHRVQRGECLSSITARYGLSDYRLIYDHPDNTEFKRKRPNPNVIFPGDEIHIPDAPAPKTVSCTTGKQHKFKVKLPAVKLRLHLDDGEGNAYADKRYELRVSGLVLEGRTDGSGMVEQPIPAHASQGELTLFLADDAETGLKIPLELGDLDPADEVSGAQARLENLGFNCGGERGKLDNATRDALRLFQEAHGLEVTGELDDATAAKLRAEHEE